MNSTAIYNGHLTLPTLDAYRDDVTRTAPQGLSFAHAFHYGAMGVAGEAGELVELIKKSLYPQFHRLHVTPALIRDEAGDVAFYSVYLLNLFAIPTRSVSWPAHALAMSADPMERARHCTLVLAKEAGDLADLTDRHLLHPQRLGAIVLENAVNDHCGRVLHATARLLSCYDMTLLDALTANVAKRAERFPAVEASA